MTITVAIPDVNGLPKVGPDGEVLTKQVPNGTPIKNVNSFDMEMTSADTAQRAADAAEAGDRAARPKEQRIEEDFLADASFINNPTDRAVIGEIISRLVPPLTPDAFEAAVLARMVADPELD